MTKEELEQIRQLVLVASVHIPSHGQCLQGDRNLLAGNSHFAFEKLTEALLLLKKAVNKP